MSIHSHTLQSNTIKKLKIISTIFIQILVLYSVIAKSCFYIVLLLSMYFDRPIYILECSFLWKKIFILWSSFIHFFSFTLLSWSPTWSTVSSSGAFNTRRTRKMGEQIQMRALKIIRELEHLSFEERILGLLLFNLKNRSLQGEVIVAFQYLKGVTG